MKYSLTAVLGIILLCNINVYAKHKKVKEKKKKPSYFLMTKSRTDVQEIPIAYSLRKFSMRIDNSKQLQMSSFYSLAFCYSILKNAESNSVRNYEFSPAFLIRMAANDIDGFSCTSIVSFQSAFSMLNKYGICSKKDYGNAEIACDRGPIAETVISKAIENANATEVIKVAAADEGGLLAQMKNNISRNVPLIVNLRPSRNFMKLSASDTIYRTEINGSMPAESYIQAVCTGFNDSLQLLEFANCNNSGIGNNGYFYVRYENLKSLISQVYAIILKNYTPVASIKRTDKCDFKIRFSCVNDKTCNTPKQLSKQGFFELSDMVNKGFNVEITTGSKPYKLYMASSDGSNTRILFPYSKDTSQMSFYSVPKGFVFENNSKEIKGDETIETNTILTLPNREDINGRSFFLTTSELYFVILLSDREINFKKVLHGCFLQGISSDTVYENIKRNAKKIQMQPGGKLSGEFIEFFDKLTGAVCIIVKIK